MKIVNKLIQEWNNYELKIEWGKINKKKLILPKSVPVIKIHKKDQLYYVQ